MAQTTTFTTLQQDIRRYLERGFTLVSDQIVYEQIPRLIFVASLARTQRIATPLGTYSIHHLAPELFAGFDGSEELGYVAVPEKALFDTVYLRAAVGGSAALPELELPPGFREERLGEWVDRVARPRLRTLVSLGLDKALAGADRPT